MTLPYVSGRVNGRSVRHRARVQRRPHRAQSFFRAPQRCLQETARLADVEPTVERAARLRDEIHDLKRELREVS